MPLFPDTFRTLAAAVLLASGVFAQDEPATPPTQPDAAPAQLPPPALKPEPAGEPASPPTIQNENNGREVSVLLTTGQVITGVLLRQDDKEICVRVGKIRSTFPNSMVTNVEVLKPVLERYADIKSGCGNDPVQLLALVEWLEEHDELDLALVECENLLKNVDPFNGEALRKRVLLNEQVRLRAKRAEREPDAGVAAPVQPPPERTRPEFPLLTPAQINLLKIYEVDLRNPPKLMVRPETIDKLIERYGDHELMPRTKEGRDALYRKSDAEVLGLMFQIRARDLYGEAEVLRGEHSRGMRAFRDNVQAKWLVNACGTTECHGGAESGRFRLFNERPTSEASVYTNFLILDRFRTDRGDALINFETPQQSVLLQIGLPRHESASPHPPVLRGIAGKDVYKPIFAGENDRRFQQAIDWIKQMYKPHPTYPLDYVPAAPFETLESEVAQPAR